ncbi:hypothetical protein PsAD5_02378 [Pseudovibrio sp. Ad5]|nr:hypothetical protein PsAD5_02378 [Pseudovibrio sp. Ad5]KZK98623.1 hypothetical protein PsW74_03212 [Pseudovibrio sp. W74]KZL09116.1 hypothetical protein PsAD14_02177 [Pseudovibrio sp. Ad14]
MKIYEYFPAIFIWAIVPAPLWIWLGLIWFV